jgi:DNA-binding transcriptional ArsR family regulator
MEIIDVKDARTIRAIAHPMRQQILSILGERDATSGELAREMGVSPPALGYHLGALVAAKLIEPFDAGPPRGPRGQR